MRRIFCVLVLFALMGSVVFAAGDQETFSAKPFPSDSIELIVPFGAGGGTDRIARAVANALQNELGQPVVVVNKTAAGGVMGSNEIAQATPDGYTIGVFSNTDVANFEYKVKTGVEFTIDSFTYLGGLNVTGDLLIAAKGSGIESLSDFVSEAKASAGTVTVALPSGTQNLNVSIMEDVIGIDVSGVVFGGGGEVMSNLIGGHTDVGILSAQFAGQAEEQGLVVLGVMLDERLETIDHVPTFAELGYPVSNTASRMLVAPKGLPQDVIDAYENALANAYAGSLSTELRNMGEAPVYKNSTALKAFLEKDFAMRKKLLSN